MKKTFSSLIAFGILSTASLFAGTYNVDTDHSTVGFKIKHMMISDVNGKFDKFSGSISYDEKTKTIKAPEMELLLRRILTFRPLRRLAGFLQTKLAPFFHSSIPG